MHWWVLGIALLIVVVVAAAFLVYYWSLRPWRELEHLLTRIGHGEQPPTFLLGGMAQARRVGLALEQLLVRQRELDRQVTKDAAEVRAVLAALTNGLLVVDSSQHISTSPGSHSGVARAIKINIAIGQRDSGMGSFQDNH